MQKHTIRVALPQTVNSELECQELVLGMLGKEDGTNFTNLIIRYIQSGDIWFFNLDVVNEGDQQFMQATRFFDSEDAKNSFVSEAQGYFDTLNAEVIIDQNVTFEEFASYAAEHREVERVPENFTPEE